MIKSSLIVFFFIFSLSARENPFFPAQGEKDLPFTSNENRNIKDLGRVSLSLPSTARILKKITVEYENLDASIDTRSIELENAVDWHLPIFVSQSFTDLKATLINKKQQSFKEVAKIKYASFHIDKKILKIFTQDKLMRNFLLAQPHRIVMDFACESSMRSYFKDIKNSVYTKVRIGNHKDYYRVVIELDGYYRYKLQKMDKGYVIKIQ